MVLPVSGFLPVPLPMMIPFMGAQSLVIGKMFGEGFQYGKRKISAMPNAEFNKLTFEDMMSNARDEMRASIPTMQHAIQDMLPLVETIVSEFTAYLTKVIQAAPKELGSIVNVAAHAALPHEQPEQGALSQIFPDQFRTITSETEFGGDVANVAKLSTISGLTVKEAQAQAVAVQKAFEAKMALQKRKAFGGRVVLSKFPQPVPQLGRGRVGKKKAGQSQIMERKRMIRSIMTNKKLLDQGGVGAKRLAIFAKRIRNTQQQLVNLLARYRF